MLKLKDKKITFYRGGYQPVNAYKNQKRLGGYTEQAVSETTENYTGTYDDNISLFGKSGYKPSVNLCPPPEEMTLDLEEDGVIYNFKLTQNSDGTFNFIGARIYGLVVTSVTLPAGSYTVSGCKFLELWWKGCDKFVTLPASFFLEQEREIEVSLWCTATENVEFTNQYIQIEKGNTATEYKPFCGNPYKEVSPDNPKVIVGAKANIKTSGKNLLDISAIRGTTVTANGGTLTCQADGGITGSGTPIGSVSFSGLPRLYLPVGQYTLSAKGEFSNIACSVYIWDKDENIITSLVVNNSTNRTFDLSLYPEYGYITFEIKRNNNNIPMDGTAYLQLEKGSGATEYHPFYGISEMECPELFGIEVASTDKYNYTETVDGISKYYICDTLIGSELTRRIGKRIFDGTETGWVAGSYNFNDSLCQFVISNNQSRGDKNALCSHFRRVNNLTVTDFEGAFSNEPATTYNQRFLVAKSRASTVDEWKAWLAEQYAKGTPVTVYYVLTEPTVETVTECPKTFPRATEILVETLSENANYGLANSIKIQE